MTNVTPSLVSKARGEILDGIISTARPERVIIGLANQIDSASVYWSDASLALRDGKEFVGCGRAKAAISFSK